MNPKTKRKYSLKKCLLCNKKFAKNYKESYYQWQGKKYCSTKCVGKAQDKRVQTQCICCGKPIRIKQCLVHKKNFCSYKCHYEYRRGKPSGLKHSEKSKQKMQLANLGNKYFLGRKHTQETKEKLRKAHLGKPKPPFTYERKKYNSDKLVGKRPKNMQTWMCRGRTSSHHGWIDFGKGRKFYMRSVWERNISRYFEFLKIKNDIKDWEYEPQRFFFEGVSFGNRTYLPDFRITNNDGYQYYVEVKGWVDNSSRIKLNRMGKYFPNIEVQIIAQERYMEISKIAPVIKDWEWDRPSKKMRNYIKRGWA